jgi:hypothetical protein
MVNLTPEEIIKNNEAYQKRLAEMSPAERYDEENFSIMGDMPILKRMPINQKAFLYDLIPGLSRLGKYDVGDLQPKEIEQLYKLIYDAAGEGQTSGRIDYTDQGGYGGLITTDAREQLQRNIDANYVTEEWAQQTGLNDPSDERFLKQLNDPEFIMKTFLGKFDYRIDDNGNVIITDKYDANLNKPEARNQSGRLQRFFSNLKPGENYPMSVLSGIAGLLGSAEGKGAPIEINLGTMEDISKELNKQYNPKHNTNEEPNRVDELLSELTEEERNGV